MSDVVHREETEIIEGEVVEVQIDRPTTASVSEVHTIVCVCVSGVCVCVGSAGRKAYPEDHGDGNSL